jgi:hypothetical protein
MIFSLPPAGATVMVPKVVRKILRRGKQPAETRNLNCDADCPDRLSKKLKYDTAVPGDRGDCQQQSLTQGSE